MAQDSNVHAKVETEDAAGNPASAEADRGYGVDTDLPEASITIDTIAGEAKVTTTDDAGNTTTATDEKPYDVDVTPPEAEIEIDPITGDDVINKEESGGDVTITGTVGHHRYRG
ncbi:Ig-like domain-containing protein [Alcaligenes faecalis]|uniref:Ig-like domain-containing protein n=1 Tax=Alcaligenes faecalis TaxID=511 RepID=UPI0010CA3B50|nr:Ig-like domain-containing protein [Alcaligenes faecalis]